MNKLTIIGNLTRDPETRATNDGHTVCSFTIAVNRRRQQNGHPVSDFFRVSAWNKLGEICQQYLSKGKKAAVVGPVSVSSYEAKDGSGNKFSLDVLAEDVEFLSPRDSSSTSNTNTELDDEDKPF